MSSGPGSTGTGGVAEARQLTFEELDAFAAACTVLSRLLLAAPAQPVLDATRRADMLAVWPLPPTEPTRRGLDAWQRSADAAEDERAVRRDHRRLFVGPGPLLAPPYESVHLSVDRLVFEEQTRQVRAVYARHGLAAPRLDRDPDDHIGLELDLLANLAVRAMDALEAEDPTASAEIQEAKRAFLADHLLRWAPGLMHTIEEQADTAFYRGVAALGAGLTGEFQRWVEGATAGPSGSG